MPNPAQEGIFGLIYQSKELHANQVDVYLYVCIWSTGFQIVMLSQYMIW